LGLFVIRNDYILRLIENISRLVAKLAGLKKEGLHTEALAEIDEAYRRAVGLSSRLIGAVSEEQLSTMVASTHVTNIDQFMLLAILQNEEGDVYEAMGQPDAAYSRYRRALTFLLLVHSSGKPTNFEEYFSLVPDLLGKLEGATLEPHVQLMLANYLISSGQYARGEDLIFGIFDNHTFDRNTVEWAISIYHGLRDKSDEELGAGGLPREEVEESLQELEQLLVALGPAAEV
jgi:hypothetical protein